MTEKLVFLSSDSFVMKENVLHIDVDAVSSLMVVDRQMIWYAE